uniref:hypothetical protein n=3 Tax=Neisseria polysaccharea TaxID=489 RepID=UPI00272B8C31
GYVIILPKTIPPKTVSGRLDLSFGIFARRGEKYSCYKSVQTALFAFSGWGQMKRRQTDAVIPAQAGI